MHKNENNLKITVPIDDLLDKHGQSFYWLSKETGVSYTTLWRLKKGRSLGINFATLEKICCALQCQPGDVLQIETRKPKKKAASQG
jgi:putative transcriptional regulator